MQHDFVRPFDLSLLPLFFQHLCICRNSEREREGGEKSALREILSAIPLLHRFRDQASQPASLVVTNRTFVHFQSCPQQLYPPRHDSQVHTRLVIFCERDLQRHIHVFMHLLDDVSDVHEWTKAACYKVSAGFVRWRLPVKTTTNQPSIPAGMTRRSRNVLLVNLLFQRNIQQNKSPVIFISLMIDKCLYSARKKASTTPLSRSYPSFASELVRLSFCAVGRRMHYVH